MKHFLLIFVFVVSAFKVAHSQEYIYQRGLATLSMGIAYPAYDFGRFQDIELTSYATLGTNINAEVSYFYSWHAGVTFMINYSVNPVDNVSLAEGYMLESPAFTTVVAETESFHDLSGLAGLVFDIPANEYFSFTFKMMAGLRNVYKPAALVKTTTIFSSVDYYETRDTELILAFLFSSGIRIIVNDHFNVHGTASYMGSTFNFEYFRNSTSIDQKAHIGALMINAGVSYSF